MRALISGLALSAYALVTAAAPATTTASHPQSTAHATKPATSFVFCKTTATPQYYSSIFESSSWNHATAFQAYVAKKYNRGSQAAICYPRATKDQAEKYMDQLIASARANVPEDAPKREVVVRTNWSPPPPEPPKPATAPMAAASTAAAPAAPAQTPAPQ